MQAGRGTRRRASPGLVDWSDRFEPRIGGSPMTSLRLLIASGTALSALFQGVTVPLKAQTPAPLIVGRWKLNTDKSNLPAAADRVEIRQYVLRPDGFLVGLLITTDARGTYHYLQ